MTLSVNAQYFLLAFFPALTLLCGLCAGLCGRKAEVTAKEDGVCVLWVVMCITLSVLGIMCVIGTVGLWYGFLKPYL